VGALFAIAGFLGVIWLRSRAAEDFRQDRPSLAELAKTLAEHGDRGAAPGEQSAYLGGPGDPLQGRQLAANDADGGTGCTVCDSLRRAARRGVSWARGRVAAATRAGASKTPPRAP